MKFHPTAAIFPLLEGDEHAATPLEYGWYWGVDEILVVEPAEPAGYSFVTVIRNNIAEGHTRGVADWFTRRAAELLGFDFCRATFRPEVSPPARINHWVVDRPHVERKPVETHFTYFIQADIGGPIKIGKTNDIRGRIETFQVGCPFRLVVLATAPNSGETSERSLHKRFASQRVHGEWFEPHPALEELISKLQEMGQ